MTSEFSIQKIAAWALVIALGSIALVVVLVSIAKSSAHGKEGEDTKVVAQRIAPVAQVTVAAAAGGASAARSGEALYNSACVACHGTGAAGAPKLGDAGAWAPRIKAGLDALVKSATAGKNAMPPKGGSDASDEELKRAIVYMANQSGGKFAEAK